MASIQITNRGSYEHYKTGTKVFINWLTKAAHKCCKLDDVISALKNRSGRSAKKNGEEVSLTTHEIVALCQKVADKKKAKITDWILGLLRTIIDRRTTAAVFHSNQSVTAGRNVQRSNSGHVHFIGVLQQAHDLFSAVDKSRITRSSKHGAVSTPDSPLQNQFEHLILEDLPEPQLDEDEIEQLAAEAPRINFRIKTDNKQETLVQLLCILSDVQSVRLEIESTFKQYTCGEVTLDVACMIANSGFGIIRRTFQRFVDQHEDFNDYAYMLKFLGLRMERRENLVAVFPQCTNEQHHGQSARDASGSIQSEQTQPLLPLNHDTASLMCASGADIMLGLLDEFQTTTVGLEPTRHGFAQILYDGIPELQKLKANPKSNPAILAPVSGLWWGDEFLSGIFNYTFGDQRGLPLWLAVVTQCYRNIYDMLSGRMDCGMEHESERWTRYLEMIESIEKFQYCKGETPNIERKDDWSELFNICKKYFSGPRGTKKPFVTGRYEHRDQPMHLITNLPTVSAGMSFGSTITMYGQGYSIGNTSLVIQCAAHLYAACRSTKSIPDDLHWRDMDFFLEHHSLFTDTVPGADPYLMINHFLIAIGSRQSTPTQIKANLSGRAHLPVRWCMPKSKFMLRYAKVAMHIHSKGSDDRNLTFVDILLDALAHCFNSELQHKSAKLKQKNYTPIELLSAFKKIMIADEPERNFDMMGFSQKCSDFVAEVRAQTCEIISDLASSWSPTDVTASILMQASRLIAEGRPASDPGTSLTVISKIIEKTVADHGDKFVKDTYTRSSGFLSPRDRPVPVSEGIESKMYNHFDAFVHECLGKAPNWTVEDTALGAAIYHIDGKPETYDRLARVYDGLRDCDLRFMTIIKPDCIPEYNKFFEEGMRRWVDEDFDDKAVPWFLCDTLAMSLEDSSDADTIARMCELLAKLVRGSEQRTQ
jgi:hypothetical protein